MKTKIYLFIAVIAFLSVSASAQKEMLTKQETINYIDKKIKESEGLWYYSPSFKKNLVQETITFSGNGDGTVKIDSTRSTKMEANCKESTSVTFRFKPETIASVELESPDTSSRGTIIIKLIGKTARVTTNLYGPAQINSETGECLNYRSRTGSDSGSTVDNVWVSFLITDPTNFDKLRKAFMHLRDLAKAEDDPFGN